MFFVGENLFPAPSYQQLFVHSVPGGLNHSDLVVVRSPLASCDLILLAAKVVQIARKEGKGYLLATLLALQWTGQNLEREIKIDMFDASMLTMTTL